MTDRYVLHDGDRWYYHLGHLYRDQIPHADGRPMELAAESGWWFTDHEASEIVVVGPPTKEVVGYRLREGIASSDTYPAELTRADREARDQQGEDETADALLSSLYEAVTEERGPSRKPMAGPWLRLEGAPPPEDGLTWRAALPHALRYASAYRHLFPGEFSEEFRGAVAGRLDQLPGVAAYAHSSGPLSVYMTVEWDDPPIIYEKRQRDRVRKPYPKRALKREVKLSVPYRISGVDRVAAKARWDAEMTKVLSQVEAIRRVRACAHCEGRGFHWGDEQEKGSRDA